MLPAGSPLAAWLDWLETLHPEEIELGLDRVGAVLERLDIELPEHILVIAGTNGKGSCVAMAAALLRAAGYRVGCYTSPHIVAYNERITVADTVPPVGARHAGDRLDPVRARHASDNDIIDAFRKIETLRNNTPLTYFEYGTLAAFLVFAAAELDVWILEVGMGGRLDATNLLDTTGVLITNVALDHCDWLGEDVETIAAEKAGVMRPGVPAVYGGGDVPDAIVSHAAAIGAPLLLPGRDFTQEGVPQPGLPGEFQRANAAAVLALLGAAGLGAATDKRLVDAVLPGVILAGRGQRVDQGGREWLLDVAHNPAAATALASALAEPGHEGETVAVISALDDKDIEGVVAPLDEYVALWIAVTADSHRAVHARELARRIANACGRPCLVAESLDEALDEARRASANGDRILVTGSFYLVGPVLERLGLYSRPQP